MCTKKINFTEKVSNVVATAKTSAKKINEYALNTTEEVVTETITIAEQWQKVTDKALKGGVKLMENQQNLIFDTLETVKTQLIDGKKKLKKVFA